MSAIRSAVGRFSKLRSYRRLTSASGTECPPRSTRVRMRAMHLSGLSRATKVRWISYPRARALSIRPRLPPGIEHGSARLPAARTSLIDQAETATARKGRLDGEARLAMEAPVDSLQHLPPGSDCRTLWCCRIYRSGDRIGIQEKSTALKIDPFGERRFARPVRTGNQGKCRHWPFRLRGASIHEGRHSYYPKGHPESSEFQTFAHPVAPLHSTHRDRGRTRAARRQGLPRTPGDPPR